jgi:ATP:ADP antiporter, AAA family
LRESLYIPTVKDIRFKSKAWIDSFGTKAAKSFAAAVFDMLARLSPGSAMFLAGGASFFTGVLLLWVVDAWYLGKTYQKAIDNNEVIGA